MRPVILIMMLLCLASLSYAADSPQACMKQCMDSGNDQATCEGTCQINQPGLVQCIKECPLKDLSCANDCADQYPEDFSALKECSDNCTTSGEETEICINRCSKGLLPPILIVQMGCIYDCKQDKRTEDCIQQCSPDATERDRQMIPSDSAMEEDTDDTESAIFVFEFWAMMGFFAVVVGAVLGWHIHKIKRKEAIDFIEMVDTTFDRYCYEKDMCITKMNELKRHLKGEFKKGNIDESNFDFILQKIDQHLERLRII